MEQMGKGKALADGRGVKPEWMKSWEGEIECHKPKAEASLEGVKRDRRDWKRALFGGLSAGLTLVLHPLIPSALCTASRTVFLKSRP